LLAVIVVYKHHLRVDQFFSLFFCAVFLAIQGSLFSTFNHEAQTRETFLRLAHTSPQPIILANDVDNIQEDLPQINDDSFQAVSAKSYVVVDINSAAILKSRNKDMPLYPASTVKLMTALVAKELYQLEDQLQVNPGLNAAGNKVGFVWGGNVTVSDLLASILINSGNDAALILAYHHPDGYQAFIDQMNSKAKDLSLLQTSFANPTGIDDYRQLSSSWDLSLLAREVLKDSLLSVLPTYQQMNIRDQKLGIEYHLNNTNQLLNDYQQVRGLKTGTTLLAQQVLITVWEEGDNPILIVVMGSTDRYQDTRALIDWVGSSVSWR